MSKIDAVSCCCGTVSWQLPVVLFDGANIWVTNSGDGTVSKIDAVSNVVAASVNVGAAPIGLAFDGSNIWIANFSDATVSKVPAG